MTSPLTHALVIKMTPNVIPVQELGTGPARKKVVQACTFACRYPNGYTLLFISCYSSAYTAFHWAVYNQDQAFYGFDDGDITLGGVTATHTL